MFNILIDGSTDVAELKRRVEEQDSQWEVQRQRLIFQGRELRDQDLLSQCGLDETNPSVHLVMRLPQPGTTKRWKHKDEAATVAKPTRYTRSTVKIETDEESLESAYETLGDCSGRLDLNDVLDECRFELHYDQSSRCHGSRLPQPQPRGRGETHLCLSGPMQCCSGPCAHRRGTTPCTRGFE